MRTQDESAKRTVVSVSVSVSISGALLLAAALGPGVSAAQEGGSAEASGSGGIEEITVTARKRRESIIDTPVSITAVTAESLELKGIEDRRDLNRFTPGFKAQPQNTSGATRLINNYSMRGLGAVNLFWNGVPLSGGDIPELLDLERVEVLKGPQTAYFGRSTFSGAINFIAKEPSANFQGYGELDFGSWGNRNAKAGVEGAIVPGVLAGRIAADYRVLGGQYQNYGYGGDRLGEQETKAATASLLYTPTEDLAVRLYYADWRANDGPNAISYMQTTDYTCNAGGAPAGTLNFFCGEISRPRADRISQLPVFPEETIRQITALATTHTVGPNFITFNGMKRHGQLGQLFADYDLPRGFTASLSLSRMKNDAGQIFDYGSRYYGDGTFNPSITTYAFDDEYAEFRIASDPNDRLRGLLGVSYVDSAQTIQSVISKSGVISVSFPPTIIYSETLGFFGSLSYDVFDRLTATFEGRYQEDTVGRETIGVNDLSGNTYSFVPRAILEYEIRDNVNAFLSYSEGSRPGALNTGFRALPDYAKEQVRAQFAVPETVPEETLENYEIGLKGNFFDNTLRLLASVYYAEWTNRHIGAALFYTNLNGVLAQANVTLGAGGVDARGTEWEMIWAPTENLTVDATYAYNRTSIVRTTCAACRQITGNLNPVGTRFARFPDMAASLGATYTHVAFSDFNAYYRLDANYQGKEYADETNVVWLAPYVMSNARIGLQNDRYKVELYGLNVFDNKVPQAIAQTQDQITGQPTITVTPPLKPTFGLRVGMKF